MQFWSRRTWRKGRRMALQVIGAGLGRTGTTSLKRALEQLLGGPCYHMLDVQERTDDADFWGDAYEGQLPSHLPRHQVHGDRSGSSCLDCIVAPTDSERRFCASVCTGAHSFVGGSLRSSRPFKLRTPCHGSPRLNS
jgi:hypothetical protein